MWSQDDIHALVLEIASDELNDDAVAELVYLLKAAQQQTPEQIASVAIDTPLFWETSNPFPPRLAYGVVHHSLFFLDSKTRETLTKLYMRQVNKIRFYIEQYENEFGVRLDGPKASLGNYQRYFESFSFTTTGFIGLADEDVAKGVIGAVLENIILATESHQELVRRLLKRVTRHLHAQQIKRLAQRVRSGIEEGLNNNPIDDNTFILETEVDQVRFRKSYRERPGFSFSAKSLQEIAAEYR